MAGSEGMGAWARRILVAACGGVAVASCSSPPTPAPTKPAPPVSVDRHPPTTPVEVAEAPSPEPAKPAPAPAFAPRFDPPRPAPPKVEPTVRVRVGTRLRQPQSFTCLSGDFMVSMGTERWTAAAPLRVAATATGWQVTAKGGPRSFAVGPLELRPIGKASLEWDGAGWPGVATLVPLPEGVDVVMEVGVEEYLPGVLAKELYPHWDEDAFRAQAVAARSWVLVEESRWRVGATTTSRAASRARRGSATRATRAHAKPSPPRAAWCLSSRAAWCRPSTRVRAAAVAPTRSGA